MFSAGKVFSIWANCSAAFAPTWQMFLISSASFMPLRHSFSSALILSFFLGLISWPKFKCSASSLKWSSRVFLPSCPISSINVESFIKVSDYALLVSGV